MKTKLTFLFLLLMGLGFLPQSLRAQSPTFTPGSLNLSVGTTVLQNDAMNLPLMVSAEYAAMDYVGAGAYLGYAVRVKKDFLPVYNGSEWVLRNLYVNYVMVGGHASFHFWNLIEDLPATPVGQKLDVFATGYVGARFIRRGVLQRNSGYTFNKQNQFFLGASLTARYFFTPELGGYLEAGRMPSGYVGFGVVYRLGGLG